MRVYSNTGHSHNERHLSNGNKKNKRNTFNLERKGIAFFTQWGHKIVIILCIRQHAFEIEIYTTVWQ